MEAGLEKFELTVYAECTDGSHVQIHHAEMQTRHFSAKRRGVEHVHPVRKAIEWKAVQVAKRLGEQNFAKQTGGESTECTKTRILCR